MGYKIRDFQNKWLHFKERVNKAFEKERVKKCDMTFRFINKKTWSLIIFYIKERGAKYYETAIYQFMDVSIKEDSLLEKGYAFNSITLDIENGFACMMIVKMIENNLYMKALYELNSLDADVREFFIDIILKNKIIK